MPVPDTPKRYRSPHGRHRHQCPYCKTVWEHEDTCNDLPDRLHDKAHTCPNCSLCSDACFDWYFGRKEPSVKDHHES